MRRIWFIVFLLGLSRAALAGSGVPSLRIVGGEGVPGDEVLVTVELDAGNTGTVLEVYNDVAWDSLVPVRKLSDGEPDCFADLRVVPNFASFTCIDDPCTSLHAEVRSQGLPLANGPIYGCFFEIDSGVPGGEYPLHGSAAMWADADRQLHAASSEDGFIRVLNPTPTPTAMPTAPVAIAAGATSAPPGGNAHLQFDFTDTTGSAIDTRFDVVLENAVFDLTMIGDACTLDARLSSHRLTVLSLGDEDVPAGFTRIRFNVFDAFKPIASIPSGPLLSCTVPVRIDAPLGASRVDLQRAFADDLEGLIPGVTGIDGFLVVTTATETPTATPTATATPPATVPCLGDCDGNDRVDVSEAVLAVRIALGAEAPVACEAIDGDRDGHATVDELVAAAGNLIHGCPRANGE